MDMMISRKGCVVKRSKLLRSLVLIILISKVIVSKYFFIMMNGVYVMKIKRCWLSSDWYSEPILLENIRRSTIWNNHNTYKILTTIQSRNIQKEEESKYDHFISIT